MVCTVFLLASFVVLHECIKSIDASCISKVLRAEMEISECCDWKTFFLGGSKLWVLQSDFSREEKWTIKMENAYFNFLSRLNCSSSGFCDFDCSSTTNGDSRSKSRRFPMKKWSHSPIRTQDRPPPQRIIFLLDQWARRFDGKTLCKVLHHLWA